MPLVDAIVCAGDVVGYGLMPAACVERIRSVATPIAKASLEYACQELSDAERQWLTSLPPTATLADAEYLLVHSHPECGDEYVYTATIGTLAPFLEEYAGLIFWHTHIQHKATFDDTLVVNPGSVSQL